jgi:iron-sulfur cluster assembly protein
MSDVMHHVSESRENISLTESAVARILSYTSLHASGCILRLSVKKTGCSGLSYVMDYVPTPKEGDIVLPSLSGCSICIDKGSYPYLKGMQIDYVKQGLNHKFVFNNPNQTGACGCGESFTVS